ncbi:hypothetical protein ELQ88_28115 [Pseudomonas sp. MPC6]|nr:hypothetical protein ELQ88_28115 [Pseudomonas sp. MPC6]
MLAMDVNDNAGCLTPRGVLRFFASKLAPTAKAISRSPQHSMAPSPASRRLQGVGGTRKHPLESTAHSE